MAARTLLLLGLGLLVLAVVATPARAGLIDLLLGGEDDVDEETVKRDGSTSPLARNCTCAGAACHCCVAFDFTYIDLGGPGCVSMKYVSPTEGIALNISYGDSLLLSDAVKGSKPEPACLDLLSDLAQVCARFSQLAPTDDGLRWCLALEPALLGETQASYGLGCFRMGPRGMSLERPLNVSTPLPPPPPPPPPPRPAQAEASNTSTDAASELSDEELFAAVNQSAEEGIAFFSNLLGLTFGNEQNETDTTTETPEEGEEYATTVLPDTSAPDES